MSTGEHPEFYLWKIVAFGNSPHERIERTPTKAELNNAQVIVVRFRSTERPDVERYVTIRHPVGFGVLPFRSLMEDIQQAVDLAAERYNIELVEHP